MKTPFRITFKKIITDTPNKTILENFKENFNSTYCDYIKIISDNELVVRNEFIRLKPDLNFNLWVGIGSAKITIEENNIQKSSLIKYSIDFTRLTIIYLFVIIIPFVILPIDEYSYILIPLITILSIALITHVITFIRHWSIFLRTIKYGTEYLGKYDWENIIKQKNDAELNEIVQGSRNLPTPVIVLAKQELEKRKKVNTQNE